MRVQVSQHKGIRWKLMNRLVRHIRVIADIARGIWEPVIHLFPSEQICQDRTKLSVIDVVHISAKGDGSSGEQPSESGNQALEAAQRLLHHIPEQSVGNGKREHKRKRCHERPHQMVCLLYSRKAQLRQINRVILPSIIIVDRTLAVPDICGRERIAAHHGRHEAVVHKLLGSACLRTKS